MYLCKMFPGTKGRKKAFSFKYVESKCFYQNILLCTNRKGYNVHTNSKSCFKNYASNAYKEQQLFQIPKSVAKGLITDDESTLSRGE